MGVRQVRRVEQRGKDGAGGMGPEWGEFMCPIKSLDLLLQAIGSNGLLCCRALEMQPLFYGCTHLMAKM